MHTRSIGLFLFLGLPAAADLSSVASAEEDVGDPQVTTGKNVVTRWVEYETVGAP